MASDRKDGYRLAQAKKLAVLFEAAHGRPARTTKELGEWFDSPQGRAASANNRAKEAPIIPDTREGAASMRRSV
jgi:hypothetical protein